MNRVKEIWGVTGVTSSVGVTREHGFIIIRDVLGLIRITRARQRRCGDRVTYFKFIYLVTFI